MSRIAVRRTGLALLSLVALAVVVAAVLLGTHRARVERDGLRVYCLAPAQHEPLVAAAAALGLAERAGDRVAVGGAELTPAQWRDRRPDDFLRACEALSAAQRPPGPGVLATVLPFLTGLTGALIAFGAATWRDRVTRGRALADDLRDAARAFRLAVTAYLTEWRPNQPDTDVAARREALLAQLARARAALPGRPAFTDVTTSLAGDLGPALAAGWRTGEDWERTDRDRRARLAGELDSLHDSVFRIADGLEQPLRARLANS